MTAWRILGESNTRAAWWWLMLFILLSSVSGCVQQSETKPVEEVPQPVPVVQQIPFEQLWPDVWSNPDGLDAVLSRVRGKQLETIVRAAVSHNQLPGSAAANLRKAVAHSQQARSQMHALLKYSEKGGVSLEVSWENELWKAIDKQLANPEMDGALTELDLFAARQSMAAQAIKGWFYLRAVHQHRTRAEENLQIHKQIRSRADTGLTLGRVEQQEVDQARHQERLARDYLKQIDIAEKSAGQALMVLTGLKMDSLKYTSGKSRVLQLAKGMPLELLTRRPDVLAVENRLLAAFAVPVTGSLIEIPDIPLTGKYGNPAKEFSTLLSKKSGLLDAGYPLLTEMTIDTASRRQTLTEYDAVLWQAMKELKDTLKRGRSLQNQYATRKNKRKNTATELNAARARYNASRADLSDVLNQQLLVLDADAALGYVLNRMYGQRLNSYLASAAVTPVSWMVEADGK